MLIFEREQIFVKIQGFNLNCLNGRKGVSFPNSWFPSEEKTMSWGKGRCLYLMITDCDQPEDNWLLVRNDSLAEICFYIHCIDSMNRYDLYFIYISYTPQFISYIHFIWIVCIFCINRIFCFHRIVREKIASQASHVSRQLERKTFVQNSSNLIWQPPIFCRTS